MESIQSVKDLREIDIVIDTWDDIFSDFDPRPLSERTLSEDFIFELKRRYRETRKGDFVVKIFAPVSLKDAKSENMVIQRLKKHFKVRSMQRQKEISLIRIKGIIFVLLGVCFLTFLTMAAYYKLFPQLTLEVLGIVVMPLGWFGVWEGLSKIVDTSPKYIQEEILFNKLSRAQYIFRFIEEEAAKAAAAEKANT
jgi:hypothetical protein